MSDISCVYKYFPNLGEVQERQFEALNELYRDWNDKINVVSRKDIDNLYLHHVLHSLSIARFISFVPGTKVLDLGTGGGFPGIPLAIYFPEISFTLIDGTRKKIKVVQDIADQTGLKNVNALQLRAEECKMRFDFVVSRAVASVDKLIAWSRPLLSQKHQNPIPNGLICLKGGRVKEELSLLEKWEYHERIALNTFFEEEFFKEKYLLYIQG